MSGATTDNSNYEMSDPDVRLMLQVRNDDAAAFEELVARYQNRLLAVLDHLADAHRIHHLYNAAPYGMLVPVVPAELRARAALTERDPFVTLG